MSTLSVDFCRTMDEVDTAAWDRLSQARPFAQSRWLTLLERVMPGFEPRYLLLHEAGQLVAGAVCHLQRHFLLSMYLRQAALRAVVNSVLTRRPPLSCGVPIFGAEGLLLHPGAAPDRLLPRLLAAVHDLAQQERSLFTAVDNLASTPRFLSHAGHTFVSLPAEAVLTLDAPDYERYEQALPKKKRSEIRRVRNRAREAGVRITITDPLPEHGTRVEALLHQTTAHHDNRYLYKPGLLDEAHTQLDPSACRLLLAWQGDEAIGTVTLFRSGTTGVLRWVGLDYTRTEPSYAYHLMMTEAVRAALEVGVTRLILGASVYTLKKQMGAELEARHLALRLPLAPLNMALHQAVQWRQERKAA